MEALRGDGYNMLLNFSVYMIQEVRLQFCEGLRGEVQCLVCDHEVVGSNPAATFGSLVRFFGDLLGSPWFVP